MNKLKIFFLYWVWQFPQTALGFILAKAVKAERQTFITGGGREIDWLRFERNTPFRKFMSGVSLASYILLAEDGGNEETICHERGHSIQSLYLGWLYLPVVGVYSALFCNYYQRKTQAGWCRYDRHYWYYRLKWCERWADKLGKAPREAALANIPRPPGARYPAMENQEEA